MEDKLELKKISASIIFLSLIAILISLIPLVIYYINFKEFEVSKIPSEWAQFGSYISGTTGVLLSFFAVIFALTSIYFSMKIAKYIQSKEFDFNIKQSELQIKLIHSQNKPFPCFDLTKLPNKTSIIMQNMGLGTLVVNKIVIRYNENEDYDTFENLFNDKLLIEKYESSLIYMNTAPNHVLAPNGKISLLKIRPQKEENESFSDIQSKCRRILKNCQIILDCEDIFKNKITHTEELRFFNE